MPAIHFIFADFGHLGTEWIARDPNFMDRETTIRDLMAGQIDRPLQVLEVNADEGTARDVSEDIAHEIAARVQREPLSAALVKFIEKNAGLRLAMEMTEAA